uniref:Uncharacterized protein n=1 Tax=Tetradesmus obliquus TaxID=3088 RepID=A0A383W4N1_TETOB|eukprot:jgi/Sobl393_1/9376/SZX72143.1
MGIRLCRCSSALPLSSLHNRPWRLAQVDTPATGRDHTNRHGASRSIRSKAARQSVCQARRSKVSACRSSVGSLCLIVTTPTQGLIHHMQGAQVHSSKAVFRQVVLVTAAWRFVCRQQQRPRPVGSPVVQLTQVPSWQQSFLAAAVVSQAASRQWQQQLAAGGWMEG